MSARIRGSTRVTAGLLEIGLNGALHIREEHLSMRPDACRLMYVSDGAMGQWGGQWGHSVPG